MSENHPQSQSSELPGDLSDSSMEPNSSALPGWLKENLLIAPVRPHEGEVQTTGSAVLPTWLKENLQTPPIKQRVPFGRVLLPGEDWDEVEGPRDGDDPIFVEVEDWDDDIFPVDPEDHTDK